MTLIIGNKNFSSWSLRPWLVMKHFGILFEEKLIPLDQPETTAEILKYSPSGKVPVLIDADIKIWESLAIVEYLNEKYPEKEMWPIYTRKRAWARSICTEMVSSFHAMRNHMPHDIKKTHANFDLSPALKDIERVKQIWTDCLKSSKGPFLFGDFTIADAFFAPVVNRFITYGVPTEGLISGYMQSVRNVPSLKDWLAQALNENLEMPRYN